jgi:hypothetical protein
MDTSSEEEVQLSYLEKVIQNTNQEHRDLYQAAVFLYSTRAYEGMLEFNFGPYKCYVSTELREKADYGLTSTALKNFPVNETLDHFKDISNASRFLIDLYSSTAYPTQQARKETILSMLNLKLSTMKTITESKSLKKVISEIRCGAISDSYVKLANKSKDIDITSFFEKFTDAEKAEVGIELARNGLKYKKENKGKWLKLLTTTEKEVEIYFAASDDEKSNNYLTHGRCAILTAR